MFEIFQTESKLHHHNKVLLQSRKFYVSQGSLGENFKSFSFKFSCLTLKSTWCFKALATFNMPKFEQRNLSASEVSGCKRVWHSLICHKPFFLQTGSDLNGLHSKTLSKLPSSPPSLPYGKVSAGFPHSNEVKKCVRKKIILKTINE